MKLVLHPTSSKQYEQLKTILPHAVLIVGSRGTGAATTAIALAREHTSHVLTITPEKDDKPDVDGTISIDRIRELYTTSRSRTFSKRVIHIADAHKMTPQAQNAFLKLLEEPPENTHFILSSHSLQNILPTILSRVQTLELRRITDAQSQQLIDDMNITDPKVRAQALFIAAGKPAELTRLVEQPETLAAFGSIIGDARTLLQGTAYDKLLVIHKYKDARQRAIDLIDTAVKLLRMSFDKAPENTQLLERMDECLNTIERLRGNGNVRIVLTRLVL